jgi:CubicO group peptidase (beta-lactamase class C family)
MKSDNPGPSRRRLIRGSVAAAAAFLVSATVAAEPQKLDDNELRRRALRQLGPGGDTRAELDALAAAGRLSGVLGVALGPESLFSTAYGLADRDRRIPNRPATQFNIASMSKMFTAVAVARLAERGRVGWHDPVSHHVRNLPRAFEGITIDHLLTHRSGLGSYFASPFYADRLQSNGRTVADYMVAVKQDRPSFQPGAAYAYSNNGYVLLGAVIQAVTGMDYFQAVEELVYRPAGMRHTAHLTLDDLGADVARGYTAGCLARPPSQCTPSAPRQAAGGYRGTPAGGAYSTLGDMLRFSTALRAGRLVRPATLELMTRRHVEIARPGLPMDGYGYGFGLLNIHGRGSFGHNGGTPGATCQLDIFSQSSLTLVVLTNIDGGQRQASTLLRRALLRDEQG